jgi:glutamate-ammonia-ligase adenylyltransferase
MVAAAGLATELPEALESTAPLVLAGSDFVAQSFLRHPALLGELVDSGLLLRPHAEGELSALLKERLQDIRSEAELHAHLRRFRHREMLRIIWRDLGGLAELDETLAHLSDLADTTVIQALEWLFGLLKAQYGTPLGESGTPQELLVLAMGKLGARELNLSSDIDLIFAYEEQGQTSGPRPIANEQFFTRLTQKLIQALDTKTADGFVFRVDTRLRPFGDAGPLAPSLDFLENYYQSQARDWERYAMVKARVVTGSRAAQAQLMELLRPFVYRRYLDFGAIESIREMKVLIAQEMHRKGMEDNIKLGPGGIREIEFIGQSFQLIRGGREPGLQQRAILPVLAQLGQLGLLPQRVVTELDAAYRFLRRMENRLQAWRDQQTHSLPADAEGRARLALGMGFADWAACSHQLKQHRRRVQGHFDLIFSAPQAEAQPQDDPLSQIWSGGMDRDRASRCLAQAGYAQPEASLDRLLALRQSSALRAQGNKGQQRLAQLMPLLLQAVAQTRDPDTLLERLLPLLEAIARRTAYLALLVESPLALSQLVRLAAESPWITSRLRHQPLLLDELLDPRRLYSPLLHRELALELDRLLAQAGTDMELQMDSIRQFAQSNMLRVAAADITGAIPLMVVSDYLSDIASVVLERTLQQSWQDMLIKYGAPTGVAASETGFVIIGYGKLGGLELGYSSDLDLVFLHQGQDSQCELFYTRMGQRLMHWLVTRTQAGLLYEVDMRLRPNGNSGPLVSNLAAFSSYQKTAAWTWEHQSLVRARAIAGDQRLKDAFEQLRLEVLCQVRDPKRLRQEVVEMRERLRTAQDQSTADLFDIKQGRGGIADIEFMVQYCVLRWAAEYPQLARWSDNIRILETLADCRLLPEGETERLTSIYKVLRAISHRHSLQERPAMVAQSKLEEERALVIEGWQALFEP